MRKGFNPWRWFRDERPDATIVYDDLGPGCRGLVEVHPDGAEVVTLDEALDRRARNATCAHEATHLIRGVLPTDAPEALRAKEEDATRRQTALALVPPEELARFVRARLTVEPWVTVEDIVEEFDVPDHVASAAAWLVKVRIDADARVAEQRAARSDEGRDVA